MTPINENSTLPSVGLSASSLGSMIKSKWGLRTVVIAPVAIGIIIGFSILVNPIVGGCLGVAFVIGSVAACLAYDNCIETRSISKEVEVSNRMVSYKVIDDSTGVQQQIDTIGKLEFLKQNQHAQLALFREWDRKNCLSKKLACNHFDWWQFPVELEICENGQFPELAITSNEAKELLSDEDYRRNYREGVALLLKGWGWDIDHGKPFSECNCQQKWRKTPHPVRLYKVLASLRLFEQDDYRKSIANFVTAVNSTHLANNVHIVTELSQIPD